MIHKDSGKPFNFKEGMIILQVFINSFIISSISTHLILKKILWGDLQMRYGNNGGGWRAEAGKQRDSELRT